MDYQIIHSGSKDISETILNIENAVKSLIKEGWEPQGGVCCSSGKRDDDNINQYVILYQAMVKR